MTNRSKNKNTRQDCDMSNVVNDDLLSLPDWVIKNYILKRSFNAFEKVDSSCCKNKFDFIKKRLENSFLNKMKKY